MQHLFEAWPAFTAAAGAAGHILLLADYDGTLARIVGRPEEAVLSPGARQKLRALAARPAFTLGIISGRAVGDVRSLAGIEGIYYSGNHGLEIEGPGLKYLHPQAGTARRVMRELAARLAAALGNVSGVIIQEKGFSLSVHYRLASPALEAEIAAAVERVTAPYAAGREVEVYPMKKLWEMRPPIDWDKGRAAALIGDKIRSEKPGRLLTIYLGDDTNDEDTFRVLRRPDGWGVFIGGAGAASAAECYLASVDEVEEFLGRLLELK